MSSEYVQEPDDNNQEGEDGSLFLPAAVRHRFVYKYQMKFGQDANSIATLVDVTDLDSPESQLERAIRGFFGFLENVDFDSKAIYDKTLDTLLSARLRQERPDTFGKNIEVSPDATFEAFLVRLRSFDEKLIKELYHIYIGAQSMN